MNYDINQAICEDNISYYGAKVESSFTEEQFREFQTRFYIDAPLYKKEYDFNLMELDLEFLSEGNIILIIPIMEPQDYPHCYFVHNIEKAPNGDVIFLKSLNPNCETTARIFTGTEISVTNVFFSHLDAREYEEYILINENCPGSIERKGIEESHNSRPFIIEDNAICDIFDIHYELIPKII